MKHNLVITAICTIYLIIFECRGDASLTDDPAGFPGHLQPLGTGRPISKVVQVDGFPEPNEFFSKFVKTNPKRAVIFKGGAKLSPAFNLWSDDYLKNHPESENMEFDIEIGKKEDRKGNMIKKTVKDFINAYHKEDIYAVTDVPAQLKNQFLLPPSIRCNNIKDRLSMMLMWFSSGGTKSVLHHDSFENINCLFRGTKRLLIAEYPKYKKQVVIDRPNGYSAVDIDKVDFTKYPGLREVEYWLAEMEEGDCLYIPFNWFHQVNSFPNKNQVNMAVNVWWHYNDSYTPEDCNMKPEEATLDKFKFSDDLKKDDVSEEGDGQRDTVGIIFAYYKEKNTGELKFDEFLEDIEKEDSTLAELGVYDIPYKSRRKKFAQEFYDAMDIDGNGKVDYIDLNALEDEDAPTSQRKLLKVSRKLDRYFKWLDENAKKESNGMEKKDSQIPEKKAKEEL